MRKILGWVCLFFVSQGFADSVNLELQNKLNKIHSLRADFMQVVKTKNRELSRSHGTMALERPGRFRWQTKDPMQQLIVADGQKLWVYDLDLDQVTVKKQEKGVGGTAAMFLTGYDESVTQDFEISMVKQGKTERYDLRAKSEKANFPRLKLIFLGDNLRGIEMFDQLDQHTIVNLIEVKTNLKLAPKLFKFSPPKGVDVVHQ